MNDSGLRMTAATGLVVGAILGLAGTFAPSDSWRALAWGLDGTALTVATALLAVHHVRRGNELAAAGFLVFVAGEAVILSGVAMDLVASGPSFAAGAVLWAASLALVSASGVMPPVVRGIGALAAILFAVVAILRFAGQPLTPLSQPLPFFAYPFLVATLFGGAWAHVRQPA